jgi:hypothetical protein
MIYIDIEALKMHTLCIQNIYINETMAKNKKYMKIPNEGIRNSKPKQCSTK